MRRISPALIEVVRSEYALRWDGIHGAGHWARVRYNGLVLARSTGADRDVVELFAFLHDARREHDGGDFEHGARAAALARELNGRVFSLDRTQLRLLEWACRDHSIGEVEADVTVQTCWDADRLDLGRVGKRPNPAYLCTAAAKDPGRIRTAYARSVARR